MSYDETLAERIRTQLARRGDVTEKKMFGGLAFLIGGHMAVAASGQGGLLVRCDPASTDDHVVDGAEPMIMRGKPMTGLAARRRPSERRRRLGALGAGRHGGCGQPACKVTRWPTRFR